MNMPSRSAVSTVLLAAVFILALARVTSVLEQTPQPDAGYLLEALVKNESLSWGVQRQPDHRTPIAGPLALRCLEGKGFWIGDPGEKRVYLTFNCGWENGLTGSTLDTLKKHQVTAAFFVTGEYAEKNPELVRRMADEGHLLGSHGYTHRSFPLLSEAEMKRELVATSEKITGLTGARPLFFRPPSGDFNRRTLDAAQEMGFTSVFWSLSYPDWDTSRQPGRQAALQRITGDIHPGAIIQLHTVSASSNEALGDAIETLRSQGYSLGSLTELQPLRQ
ncbi:MAG: polysaccharide deacetylase family protein [Firmicutes bacterium]|nr:polysaccharide deacetylase family protein [Bacillota bacterium]